MNCEETYRSTFRETILSQVNVLGIVDIYLNFLQLKEDIVYYLIVSKYWKYYKHNKIIKYFNLQKFMQFWSIHHVNNYTDSYRICSIVFIVFQRSVDCCIIVGFVLKMHSLVKNANGILTCNTLGLLFERWGYLQKNI